MQIDAVLEKICGQNDDIIAALVLREGQSYHNLSGTYDLLNPGEILGAFEDAFELAQEIDVDGMDMCDILLGFDEHSVIARKIDKGILVVLTRQMGRQHLLKLQVGLGLAGRALERAFTETPPAAVPTAPVIPKAEVQAEPAPDAAPAPKKKARFYRGVAYYD
jgi:hypothetical protein